MFKLLTELLRSFKPDKGCGTEIAANPERCDRAAVRDLAPRFRPALEVLEERATPGGGEWSG